jgi:hypothetical protein
MPNDGVGIDGPDLGGGPDLAGIGNAARASKRASQGGQELTSFSVKRGDNGGVTVCETYERKPPAGRRYGASFMSGGDYKENPYSPDDSAGAMARVTDLLGQMGMSTPAAAPTPAPEPAAPTVTAARTPTAAAMRVTPGGGGPDTGY